MTRKGSSRKGARRRQAIAAAGPRDYEDFSSRAPVEEVIKLDLGTNGIVKEIARIETPIRKEPAPLPRHAQNSELTWGQRPSRGAHRWVWMAVSAAFIMLFGGIAAVNYIAKSDAATSTTQLGGIEVVIEEMNSRSPLFAFEKDPYEVRMQCIKIFREFTAAPAASEIRDIIRQHPNTDALLAEHWKPWPSPPALDDPDLIESDYDDSDGQGYLWLKGNNQDGSPFLAFFVARENSFLLDWEATMALGESRLSNLVRDPASEPLAMRVILSPAAFYLPDIPESDYESYQITCSQGGTNVWGYIKRSTPEHTRINELLQRNSPLFEEKQDIRITLRLKKTGDATPQNRFFITEMLHKDWVMP